MGNLSVKKLKVYAIIVTVLLAICIIFVAYIGDKERFIPTVQEEKVFINNDAKVIIANDRMYCNTKVFQDGAWKQAVIEIPNDSSDEKKIIEATSNFSSGYSDMKIDDTRLYYQLAGNTNMYNLKTKDTALFCEGTLQFMVEPDSYITMYNGNLYKGKYYPATYYTRSIRKITEGNYKFIDSDDVRYYYVDAMGASVVVCGLNTKTQNIVIMDSFIIHNDTFEDVVVGENYIYELIKKENNYVIRTVNKEEKVDLRNIEAHSIELEDFEYVDLIDRKYYPENSDNKIYFYVGDLKIKENTHMVEHEVINKRIYEYDFDNNKYSLTNDKLGNNFLDNYSANYDNGEINILLHNEKLFSVELAASGDVGITLTSADYINDEFYIEFWCNDSGESSTFYFVRYNDESKELQILNQLEQK